MSFQTIQEFYNLGLWDASQIAELVQAGVITPAQYQEITGQVYPSASTGSSSPSASSTSGVQG